MAGYYAPSYLGSTADNGYVSGLSSRQSVRNCLQELEDDDVQEDKIEDPPLSPHQGKNSPLRNQSYPPSVRGPLRPPGPESVRSRTLEDTQTLKHADPFANIQNPRKRKLHTEVFDTFTRRPKGNDTNHVILGNAGLAMAKRVLHPPEAERWPSAEGSAFMKKHLTLVPNQRMSLESYLFLEPFLKEHKKNPSYKQP